MANTTTPFRDVVHKFTLVRPVTQYLDEALETRFVILENSLTAAQARTLDKADSSIVKYYKNGANDKVLRGVTWLRTRKRWIASLADLAARYPNSGAIYSRFLDPKDLPSVPALANTIDAQLKKFDPTLPSIHGYVTDAGYFDLKIALWDNMLVRCANISETPEVREECLRLIRLFWIMERLEAKTLSNDNVAEALSATVVLPQIEAAPAKADAAPNPAMPNPAPQREDPSVAERLKTFRRAAEELSRQQISRPAVDPSNALEPVRRITPPGILDATQSAALSATTQTALRQLHISKNNLHVPSALGEVYSKIKSIQALSPPPAPPQLYKAGKNLLLSSGAMSAAAQFKVSGMATTGATSGSTDPFGAGLHTPATLGIGFKIGMAPLYVVETKLLKYDKGEVAHIENVLAGETKKRNLRVLNRVEQLVATDDETTVVAEKDSQTTDKYELSQEVDSNQKEDMKLDTGVKVTADLGSVNIAASADFSYANSAESTHKVASNQARETINKAVNSITSRTRTQRSVTTINESEEKNEHALENKNPKTNIAGIYRWLDKFYLAELKCYGVRKMLEFSVPEPAAFYLYAAANKKTADVAVTKPTLPMIWAGHDPPETTDAQGYRPIQTYHDLLLPSEDPTNEIMDRIYQTYGFVLPTAPKDSVISVQTIKSQAPAGGSSSDETKSYTSSDNLVIPEGYYCYSLTLTGSYDGSDLDPKGMLYVAVGDIALSMNDFSSSPAYYEIWKYRGEGWVGPISIGYHLHVTEFVIEFSCLCNLTTEAKDKWRKEAFDAVIQEYNNQLKAYNDWLKQAADQASMTVTIAGTNPDRNREIEQEELKKHCIQILTGQRFESFDAMRYPPQVPPDPPYYGYPDFAFGDAADEGRTIQFFETVFDWHLMTYEFFPYFWANKSRWTLLKSLDDPDAIFRNFLQAGAARVQVPVRPNYNDMLDHFVRSDGELWNGGETPIPGDPLWLSVADDQKNNTDTSEGEVIDQWIIKLPTDLVFLEDFGSPPPDNTAALEPAMLQKVKDELGLK
jgi:hypothetical protein